MLNTFFFYCSMITVIGTPFYFYFRIKKIEVSEETIDQIETILNKLNFLIIVALFAMGIIQIQSKNSGLPEAAFFTCLFSFYLLQSLYKKTVNQFRNEQPTPQENFRGSFRQFSTFLLLYGFYFFTVELLIPHLGTFPSIAISIMAITFCVPFLVRITLPTSIMFESELKTEIKNLFLKSGTTLGEIYLIDQKRSRNCNAFVCGPRFGFGPFRRSLFISQNMFQVLEADEITAVICHEAAHFKLNHIFKRSFFSVGILLLSIVSVTFPAFLITNLIQFNSIARLSLILTITIVTVYVQFYFLMKLIRKQEFEADLEAIQIGCSPGSLISALEKITAHNHSSRQKPKGISKYITFNAHPGIDERIEAIISQKIPDDAQLIPNWQTGLTYASFVILAISLAFANREQNRGPASRQKLPTLQNSIKQNESIVDESLGR